jgi:hypothetical protein
VDLARGSTPPYATTAFDPLHGLVDIPGELMVL